MAENKYLENIVPKFYRRQTFDIMIFIFIDTYKFLLPSVSLEECINAFIKRYKVDMSLITFDAIMQSYYRTLALHNSNQKTKDE
jgi:hypothetical protein